MVLYAVVDDRLPASLRGKSSCDVVASVSGRGITVQILNLQ